MAGDTPKRIEYAREGGTALGVRGRDARDNPLSPEFVPLTERSEYGKARWWALLKRRSRRISHGVFDP